MMASVSDLDLLTSSYDYHLPKELIATSPASPADSAKLLVYDRKSDRVTHTIFREFLNFIPKNSQIFLNDTKVIKARLFGKKGSGGKVELLINRPLDNNRFLVMIRGRVKEGTILYFDDNLEAKVLELNSDGSRVVSFYKDKESLDFESLIEYLEKIGHIPLPPYIQREDTPKDSKDYQSLFAKRAGAVASPTASLHFTPELLEKMRSSFKTYTLTLHVGAGTFKPIKHQNILEHPMHSEIFNIPKEAIKAIESKEPILAIGTTVTRTIEHFARTQESQGECNLFLHPANPPIRVNHLLTNFHLPKSTLIMLVSAFIGRKKSLELYQEAIERGYRFYSYGDAMLII